MAFATPAAPSGGFTIGEHAGELMIIEVLSLEHITTVHGEADVIRANVTTVDGANAGEVHSDTLIFGRVLVSQLRSQIGEQVLGRLGQGNAKPGMSPPWVLEDPTKKDFAAAEKYVGEVDEEEPF